MKKHRFLALYMALLMVFTSYVALDTFVITRVYGDASSDNIASEGIVLEQEEGSAEQDQAGSSDSDEDSDSGKGGFPGSQDGSSSGSGHGPGSGSGHGPGSGKGHGPGSHKSGSSDSSGNSSSGSSESGNSDSGSSGSSDSINLGSASGSESLSSSALASSLQSSDTYSSDDVSITMKEYRINSTTIHVADVTVSSPEYLKTAFAQDSYGRNVTAKTSEIAESVNAVLAVNGDYYGAQEKGYVIRNGKIYRSTAESGAEDLVIYEDGSFDIISESEITAEQLLAKGAVQTLSFGPALVTDGSIAVTQGEEVGKAMASNPRTAIGIIDDCHYLFVVSDGRTDESEGLSLYELATFMESLGADTAYNLDGGGSSTMYFNGEVVNTPTSGGSIKERSVSDIVYIG